MLEQVRGDERNTLGGDKGVTPHVAQSDGRSGGGTIDERTTHHTGYAVSQTNRKRIEERIGWLDIAALRNKVGWILEFAAAAYNLVRVRN